MNGRRLFVAAACFWAALYAALGERMLLDVGVGGGRGVLRAGAVASAVLLPFLALASAEGSDGRSPVVDPPTIFLGVAALLPAIGVMIGYPVRTLAASAVPLASLAFLLLGRILASESLSKALGTAWLMLTAIAWVEAVAALVQTLYWRHVVVPGAPSLVAWDMSVAKLLDTQLITGRSAGLYTNPNVLSLMAGIGLVFALAAPLTPSRRALLAVPSALALGLGQSRGVMVALAVVVVVELLALTARGKLRPRTIGYVGGGLALVAGAFALLARIVPEQTGRLVSRLSSALGGTGAVDPNLGGRFGFWRNAAEVLGERPLGTIGPPELALGLPTDSDLVRVLLQGGAILVGLYVWALVWVAGNADPATRTLARSLALYVGVAALTMNASTYPPAIASAWIVFGIVTASRPARAPKLESA